MSEISKVIDKYGEKLVERIVKKLQAGNKVATGNLINSITYKYSYTNGQYKIQITGSPYLINVDRGRRAGAKMPPIKPLIAWMKAKKIGIKHNRKTKPKHLGSSNIITKKTRGVRSGFTMKTDKQIESMAFFIAKNIAARGIKPFPILNEASKILATKQFQTELKQAIIKDLKVKIKLP